MLSIIQAAGWPIWPLIACSILALALIFERFTSLKTSKVAPANLLDEAISVAGGVKWGSVTQDLELKALPGCFVAGEMLDWEAPTGGYLLTACWATGRWAGRAAAAALSRAGGRARAAPQG